MQTQHPGSTEQTWRFCVCCTLAHCFLPRVCSLQTYGRAVSLGFSLVPQPKLCHFRLHNTYLYQNCSGWLVMYRVHLKSASIAFSIVGNERERGDLMTVGFFNGQIPYMMQPSLVPPSHPNGYGYTGAMFPAPPCGWVGGVVVVVVGSSRSRSRSGSRSRSSATWGPIPLRGAASRSEDGIIYTYNYIYVIPRFWLMWKEWCMAARHTRRSCEARFNEKMTARDPGKT